MEGGRLVSAEWGAGCGVRGTGGSLAPRAPLPDQQCLRDRRAEGPAQKKQ